MTPKGLLDAQRALRAAEAAVEEALDARALAFAEAREKQEWTSGDIGRLLGIPPHVAHYAIRQGLSLRRTGHR